MAHYFRKKLKDKYYLYKGETKRVNGVPTRVNSKYIGPFDELCNYFQQTEAVVEHQDHFEFGLSRGLYDLLKQIGLPQIFRNYLKKRTADEFLVDRTILMVLNRIISPCAKYSIENWFLTSDLANHLEITPDEVTPQKIYRTMDVLDKNRTQIENALCKVIATQENINFNNLYLDFTNQETYSKNYDSNLLKFGKNKRYRDDLLQVNLSLTCDAETGIPFFHKSYSGNKNDKQFIKSYAEELRANLNKVGHTEKATLIIDRGINGFKNFELLRENSFDYIGGLIESNYPDFFNIKKSYLKHQYTCKNSKGQSRTIYYKSFLEEVYSIKHKVLTFYNQELREDKILELDANINKYIMNCEEKLFELKNEIESNTFESRNNNVEKIRKKIVAINPKFSELVRLQLELKRFDLTWEISIDTSKREQKIDNFGKHVLFTNKTDLDDKEILRLFFDKDKIEKNFQFLKANSYTNRAIALGPMLHSKDERITSHIYTCIIALQLYQILRNRLNKNNSDLTTQQSLDELSKITCYYTKLLGKNDVIRHINPLTLEQKSILRNLEIDIYK